MKKICLTNNPLIVLKQLSYVKVIDGNPLELFNNVRSEILKGYKLVTHPLTGSIGPDTNPYKSVILSTAEKKETIDAESLNIIDKAISYTNQLLMDHPCTKWDQKSLEDFQLVDYDLIKDYL